MAELCIWMRFFLQILLGIEVKYCKWDTLDSSLGRQPCAKLGEPLFPMVFKPLQGSELVSKSLDATQPVPNLGGVAAFVKAVVKHTFPATGFLKPSTQVNSSLAYSVGRIGIISSY